ncbi:hypothetical protein WICPIJ_002645 [Wickerhamomyces pijperi]|uniref:BZIP domain-containing protein n=1 Tax=Wickerhamomyces pijperi TaxID=599730 RepID=A0A9P8Q9B6_WICPI|nr:hypothetical protein WICPIJ_002645 [Wickerhamomyces pijperi]
MSSNNPSPASIAPSPVASHSTPTLTIKPSVTKIVTSKEWVLPPRPKPGRKPSVDTPVTKRKAQNRAAQRAFRERRATRVQELEEKLQELEREKELRETSLQNVVNKLDKENKSLVRTIDEMRGEFSGFKRQMMMLQQQQSQSQSLSLAQAQPFQLSNVSSPGSSPLSYQATSATPVSSAVAGSSYQNIQPQLSRSRNNSVASNGRHQAISPAMSMNMSYKSPREYAPIQPAITSSHPSPRELQQQANVNFPRESESHSHSQNHNHNHDHSHSHSRNQLPTPTSKTSISSATSSTNNITDFTVSATSTSRTAQDCGVCVKDDCICAAVGLRATPPEMIRAETITNINKINESLTPVALKKRPRNAAVQEEKLENSIEVDYTAKFSKNKFNKPVAKLRKFKKRLIDDNDTTIRTTAMTSSDSQSNMIDFTTVFEEKEIDKDFQSPLEECGFCSEDSPCVCREAAKEAANAITALQQSRSKSISNDNATVSSDNQLPPISRHSSASNIGKLPVFHPGPTVEISPRASTPSSSSASSGSTATATTTAESKSNIAATTTGCTGNPGTCTQCQMDPMSTLFCTTIASKADEELQQTQQQIDKTSPVSPPLSKVSSPHVSDDHELNSLKTKPVTILSNPVSQQLPVTNDQTLSAPSSSSAVEAVSTSTSVDLTSTKSTTASAGGIYIPCADAYKTLSRHKGFNSIDFGTLVGKLTTRGMQVEVRSVVNVLRELDRKVYN